jgi:hypothetical protein
VPSATIGTEKPQAQVFLLLFFSLQPYADAVGIAFIFHIFAPRTPLGIAFLVFKKI